MIQAAFGSALDKPVSWSYGIAAVFGANSDALIDRFAA
jgi:hypothetical protein